MNVRYWIYWNDLIQGPFELDELVGLKAFGDELLVCLEDRQEWLPAVRIADLAPELERIRARLYRPSSPPPPPPPNRSPTQTPLQGDLFGESPGQGSLFESEADKDGKPYAFAPAWHETPSSESRDPARVTMPFRFGSALPSLASTAVLEPPTALRAPAPTTTLPRPAEWHPQIIEIPKINFAPPEPVKESPLRLPLEEEIRRAPEIPLEVVPQEAKHAAPPLAPFEHEGLGDALRQLEWPRPSHFRRDEHRIQWVPRIVGIALLLIALGVGSYWVLDHFSSRSAIAEAVHPLLPKAVPVIPLRAPELPPVVNPWAHQEKTAIKTVLNFTNGTQTIGKQGQNALKNFHAKELLQAAETGHRSHLPDQIAWTAASLGGALYKVQLTFSGISPDGTRAETRSNAFTADVARHTVEVPATPASENILDPDRAGAVNKSDLKRATAIDSLLQAAVAWNGLNPQTGNGTSRGAEESANPISTDAAAARQALRHETDHVRKSFPEKTLENLSGAYPSLRKALASGLAPVETPATASVPAVPVENWERKETEAIDSVKNYVTKNGVTVHQRATALLDRNYQKELLYAASTGERQNNPDQVSWVAARGVGSRYQVSLNFSASDPRSAASALPSTRRFDVNLKTGEVKPADKVTQKEFFAPATPEHTNRLAAASAVVVAAATASDATGNRENAFGVAVHAFRAKYSAHTLHNLGAAYPAVAQALEALAASAEPAVPPVLAPKPTEISPNVVIPMPAAQNSAPVPAASVAKAPVAAPSASPIVDLWAGKETAAIKTVINHKTGGGQPVGERAKLMLQDLHEKEVIHASDTGERLYFPDKAAWSALHEEGDTYRVYLTFSALQASGDRITSRMYQFRIHLGSLAVESDDAGTLRDFVEPQSAFRHVPSVMADDVESILGGVDEINKLMMRSIIVRKTRRNKKDAEKTQTALTAAQLRLQKAMGYFRTRYPEKALMNIGHAYNFQAT